MVAILSGVWSETGRKQEGNWKETGRKLETGNTQINLITIISQKKTIRFILTSQSI